MKPRACRLFDAGALINVETDSFIFFINVDGEARLFIITFEAATPVEDRNSSGRGRFFGKDAPPRRVSSRDRYSLEADPDKLVHSLYLAGGHLTVSAVAHASESIFAHLPGNMSH